MSTETLELIELDEALDFDVECDYCDTTPVAWHLKHGDLSHVICAACKEKVMEMINTAFVFNGFLYCNVCSGEEVRYRPEDIRLDPM